MADVHLSGPMFDGRADAAVERFLDDAKREVAQQGLADVHFILNVGIQHPTPYYETQLIAQPFVDTVVVHDRGVIYGPWLEGVSSRNKTTRFKGYAAFRRTKQALPDKVERLVEPILQRHLGEMR